MNHSKKDIANFLVIWHHERESELDVFFLTLKGEDVQRALTCQGRKLPIISTEITENIKWLRGLCEKIPPLVSDYDLEAPLCPTVDYIVMTGSNI